VADKGLVPGVVQKGRLSGRSVGRNCGHVGKEV
jgi:hypothetical protein